MIVMGLDCIGSNTMIPSLKIDRKYDTFLSRYLLPCSPHPTTPMNIVKNARVLSDRLFLSNSKYLGWPHIGDFHR